jgi:MFS family permease
MPLIREMGTPTETVPSRSVAFDAVARRRVLWAAILASAMGFIDGSVLAIAIPAIREDLRLAAAGPSGVQRLPRHLSALILAGGAAGDRFGTARAFAVGIAGFVGASLLCAIAPTATLLIAAAALQGASRP